MKITIDIECTPEEARTFMGLPDVTPMQKAVMEKLQDRLEETVDSFDPQMMMRTWFPDAAKGWEQWRDVFWTAAKGGKSQKDD